MTQKAPRKHYRKGLSLLEAMRMFPVMRQWGRGLPRCGGLTGSLPGLHVREHPGRGNPSFKPQPLRALPEVLPRVHRDRHAELKLG